MIDMANLSQANSERNQDGRRWTRGSYAAAGFALFLLLYALGMAIYTFNMPTDGWIIDGDRFVNPPTLTFTQPYLEQPSPIQAGDQLLGVNGQTLEQILQAQHEFLTLTQPDWGDGTRLQYEVLRQGERLSLDVPVQRASAWEHYVGYMRADSGGSNLVMLITGLFFFVIGTIVFLLRPSNRAAHALLFLGAGFFPLMTNNTVPTSFYPIPPPSIPFDTWTLVINPSLMYLVLAFPYPKAPLRRFPRLSILMLYLTWPVAFILAYLLNLQDWFSYLQVAFAIYPVQIALMMLVTVASLIHTAITVHDPVGRSQMKWMLAGVGSFVFVGVGGWLVSAYIFPETMEGGNWLITTIGWLLLPVCLAVAITRYRLFDIDIIIRRTLVYSLLTISLGLVYFGGVVLLETLLRPLAGGENQLAIILTTLAIAASVSPLRRRIQDFIDRRFYRQKYNAEQALAEFANLASQETDLATLTGQLVGVVQETLQPQQVSLWLQHDRRSAEAIK
jgi:hypothetical protein